MVRKKEIFIIIFLIVLGAFFVYIYLYIDKAKEEIFTRIEENNIEQIAFVLKNIEEDILTSNNINTAKDLVTLFSQSSTREEYEHIMSLMLTSNVKYVYILRKDKKNKFRFLLDASTTDKANFNQKFDVNSKKYMTLYKSKKPQVIKQHDIENLYLTYLYPIKIKDEVVGFFNVDITTNIQKIILESIKPLETFFIILIFSVFLLMVMSIIQIFHYFITKKQIFTDVLTNTFNRNYLKEISPMLNLQHYSIAMLDLDRFKSINDTYGHKAGDYVLATTAKIFKDLIRDSDILIRYGGEEFLLLIHNRGDKEAVVEVCERIRKSICTKVFKYDEYELNLSVSIGINKYPALQKNLNDAIKSADKMLYIAKKNGRNRVVCYDEKSNVKLSPYNKSIDFVKESLEENRILCYYQPIYNHNTGEILKYEALVRIVDKKDNILKPIQFLPGLKHTNIHYKLTQRILSIIFERFKDSQDAVSININFSDLINPDIERSITQTLENDVDLASRVTFEILESDEIDNIQLFKEKINLLHSLKAKVSIDDFGSGYSNFKTIIDIEANYLKIDGSLIEHIDTNEKDFKVVKSIIHFAKQSDMKTVAEFVHSKEVYEKLLQVDVDFMQGYYLAKPTIHLVSKEDLFSPDT